MEAMKPCPHCGAQLPEEASFCPRCAKSVNVRTAPKPPRPFPRKLLYRVLAVALLAAVALGVRRYTQPKTYEGVGEVIYTDADGTYQLVLKRGSGRYEPVTQEVETPEEGIDYRSTMRLYINHRDSGADASGVFLQKVDFVTAEFIQDEDGPSPWTCTQPAPNDSILEAALVTLNDFTAESGDAEQVWTLHMKNGDTIVLRMPIHLNIVPAYHYGPEDVPMDTTEDLQALVDQVSRTAEEKAVVYLHLPAVTYTGNLAITERPINLYGNTEGAGRTTFTGNVQVTYAGTALLLQEFGNLGTILLAMPIALLLGLKREAVGAAHSINRETNLALMQDMFGADSPEAQGSLSVYIVGGMVGTIYFGFMASMAASTGAFHPYALGMASGVGAGILMSSAVAALSEVMPAYADQIAAMASASETISGIDGIYMAIFIGIPLCNFLYRKLEPALGRVTKAGRRAAEAAEKK